MKKNLWIWAVPAAVAVVGLCVALVFGRMLDKEPEAPAQTTQSTVPPTQPGLSVDVELLDAEPIELGQGLRISELGSYSGRALEDGSREQLEDVQMVILENTAGTDLQLARFTLSYGEDIASFEVTDLPAGASVVLLEKQGHRAWDAAPDSAELTAAIQYPGTFDLRSDALKITGSDRYLTMENISGQDISGDIVIYYKYSSDDLLYGGLTYRARLSDGLEAGASATIGASHYAPGSCQLLRVEMGA